MLRIAGQRAGPIGLNFVVDTHGWPGGCYRLSIYLEYKHHYRYDTRKDKRHGQCKDHNLKTYSGAILEGWKR